MGILPLRAGIWLDDVIMCALGGGRACSGWYEGSHWPTGSTRMCRHAPLGHHPAGGGLGHGGRFWSLNGPILYLSNLIYWTCTLVNGSAWFGFKMMSLLKAIQVQLLWESVKCAFLLFWKCRYHNIDCAHTRTLSLLQFMMNYKNKINNSKICSIC